ncbi:MAG: ABC transporter permease, partial [Rhizobiales bacterium]|nr:ABC transporter permease [Hyphomicrobiales bacterium]
MTIEAARTARPLRATALSASRFRFERHRGLATAFVALFILTGVIVGVSATPLGYYDISQIVTGGTTLAIATMGQTIVILSGGFDLSAGAVVSLVNVSLASLPEGAVTSPLLLFLIGIGIGAAVGTVNGFFIAVFRLQPIVVTLATMFILQGLTLLVMDKPGGMIDISLYEFMFSDLVPNVLPMAGALILVSLAFWFWLKSTPFGIALYAVGGDGESAHAAGISTRRTK